MRRNAVATLASALVFVVGFFVAKPAFAHAIGLSNGEYTAEDATLRAKLTFARGEVAELLPSLDENHDGHVTALEVDRAKAMLSDRILGGVHVHAAGAACTASLVDAGLTEQDGLVVEGRYTCPKAGTMNVDVALIADLARGHRHVARISGTDLHDEILYGDQHAFDVAPRITASEAARAPAATPSTSWTHAAAQFFKMGVLHILTGYDHLLFLFGLVLLRARMKQILAVVTAFTVAHSITLALAVLGVVTPSPRIIEPAIALSIAYVGVENFFVKDASKRWRITFPFGLVHGFGFAGALREIDLPRSSIPTALVTFNLGVEAGQIAVLCVFLPVIVLLRDKQPWLDARHVVRVLSGAVVLGGLYFVSVLAFA